MFEHDQAVYSFYFIYKNWSNKEKVTIDNIQQIPVQNEGLIVANSYETKVLNPSNAFCILSRNAFTAASLRAIASSTSCKRFSRAAKFA